LCFCDLELKEKIQQLEDNTRNQEDKQTEIDKLKEKLKEKTAEAEQNVEFFL
jgi:CHASE3 domain sensor protein